MAADPHSLQRFVDAQEHGGAYDRALSELRAGRKTTHWMWFVFPQAAGLGRSETARTYAIRSLAEGRAYLAHPLLGARLRACTQALLALPAASTADGVLGTVDAMKLRSSLTLFARAAPDEALFRQALARFYDGVADDASDRLLQRMSGSH